MNHSFETKTENLNPPFENIKSWDEKTSENIFNSLSHLTKELKEELPYYDAIFSDDVSGRLASLFFREIINFEKEKNNQDLVQTYFLTPRRGRYKQTNENIDEFITEKSPNITKALIVTEHIDSGSSLRVIIQSLQNNNIDFDIASISINKFIPLKKEFLEKLTYYSKGSDGLLFYKKRLEGVKRDKLNNANIHPKKVMGEEAREKGRQAREDISTIAKLVYQSLQS
jgi:hypothetical protein